MAKNRSLPEINAGSMADIAFLLLVFFLVTTTMDIPTGIPVTLPPDTEVDPEDIKLKEKNVLKVLVNSRNQLLVEGQIFDVRDLRKKTVAHITNEGRDPNLSETSRKAIVSLKADRGTEYETYLAIYNELTAAYKQVRNDYSMSKYGVAFDQLDPERDEEKIDEIKEKYPKQLSEAEPEDVGGE